MINNRGEWVVCGLTGDENCWESKIQAQNADVQRMEMKKMGDGVLNSGLDGFIEK